MAYGSRTDRRCATCSRFPDMTGRDMTHWRSCVPRKAWPRFQVEADGTIAVLPEAPAYLVTEDGTLAPIWACVACGFEAKSAAGLGAHRRKHARQYGTVAPRA